MPPPARELAYEPNDRDTKRGAISSVPFDMTTGKARLDLVP